MTGRPAPDAPSAAGSAAGSPAGPRSAANSPKVQLLPVEGARIHELRPGTARAAAPDDIQAVREWEPAPVPPGPGRGRARTTAADNPSGSRVRGADADARAEASILAFPEPPVRRRRRYVLIGAGITAVLLAALFAVLFFSPALEVKNVQVQGNSLLSAEEAEAALAPLLGTPLTLISDADAGELLAGRPEVENVKVAAVPPSDLLVTITERVPVAVLQNGREFLLIDEDGRQLKAVGERAAVALPLIDGGTEAVNSEVFSTVTAVLAALPQNVLAQLDHASAETLDSVELKLSNGQTVFWGSSEANAAKAKALEALLLVPAADPPVKVFDVSTPNRPVTR
ncbi:cell division protein FtsQ/DivIB [Arthrobacter gallicola]|uniref:cell division protein FtsQ/DivIB n=1 Tax=Arthrobacter gallicola TaxID=2762225 RepID=UPI00296B5815|nr:cell division protein FtsQ/DivIB [Arthrobacter gallicola]